MKQAVTKVNENLHHRKVIGHVVPLYAPHSVSMHPTINRWMLESDVQIRIYTHADLVSDKVLSYLVHRAEEANPELAVVVVDTRDAEEIKAKKMDRLKDLFLGAMKGTSTKRAVICGMPNAGKSSIIYPMTRANVVMTKKKKDTHAAKVSSMAGVTVGVKDQRLTLNEHYFLVDTPGLLPSELSERQMVEAVVTGCLTSGTGVSPKLWDIKRVVGYLLDGLNFDAELCGMEPRYVQILGLGGKVLDPYLLMSAFAKSDLNTSKKKENTPPAMLADLMLAQARKGALGSLALLSLDERVLAMNALSSGSTAAIPIIKRNLNSPIVYCNMRARSFIDNQRAKEEAAKEEFRHQKEEKKIRKQEAIALQANQDSL